jgi:prepilin-type processing-associated H-X9-DG protein
MKANVIGNGAVVIALCAAITLPMVIWHRADDEARVRDEALGKQKEAIEALTVANAKRKQELAAGDANALTDEQMRELLRLRAEAGALRRETSHPARLATGGDASQAESAARRKLTPEEQAERARELSADLLDAAKRIVAALPEADRRFREKQGTGPPPDFPDLRNYFPTVNGKRMPGLYTFNFIRMGGPKPGDNLILTEGGHETADGKIARTFAFADGHAEEVVAPDRENVDDYFTAWVKENWGTAEGSPGQ